MKQVAIKCDANNKYRKKTQEVRTSRVNEMKTDTLKAEDYTGFVTSEKCKCSCKQSRTCRTLFIETIILKMQL